MKHVIVSLLALVLVSCKPAETKTDTKAQETKAPDTPVEKKAEPPVSGHKIVIYYPFGTFRCIACNAGESVIKAAALGGTAKNGKTEVTTEVTAPFPKIAESGDLLFRSINIDDDRNEKLVTMFDLKSKLPVIAEMKDGKPVRFTVMKKMWKLLDDDKAFIAYVQDELRPYVETFAKP